MKLGQHTLDPQQLATSVWSLFGARGSGKTNGAGVIAEGIMDAGIPVVVIDQVGVWFGLRLKPDGKTPSRFKMPILGGAHGDIALAPTSGRQVAEALATSQSSAILDVSQLRKGERARFCADFGEAFLHAKKAAPSAVCLILEEAQEVIPQVMRFASPDIARCLGAFEDIGSVGRNFGIGLGILSLRPQKTNKEVANLSETVFGFRMGGPSERKAVAEWVQEKGAPGRDEVAGELPGLARGTAILWSILFGIYGKVALPLKSTYDASSTPGAGRAAVKTAPLDLDALEKAMATVVADAKANDPRALKETIADLKRQLAARAPAAPPAKVVEKKVIGEAALKRLEATATRFDQALIRLEQMATVVKRDIAELAALARPALPVPDSRTIAVRREPTVTHELARRAPLHNGHAAPPRSPSRPVAADGRTLGAGEIKVLTAIAQHAGGCTREQLTVLTAYRRSSRDTYLQKLRSAGLIDETGNRFIATSAGVEAIGPSFEPLPTGDALREHWMTTLPAGEKAVLGVVCGNYPREVSRDDISDATAYRRSSRDTYIQKLAARQLVEATREGVRASAQLFG